MLYGHEARARCSGTGYLQRLGSYAVEVGCKCLPALWQLQVAPETDEV